MTSQEARDLAREIVGAHRICNFQRRGDWLVASVKLSSQTFYKFYERARDEFKRHGISVFFDRFDREFGIKVPAPIKEEVK